MLTVARKVAVVAGAAFVVTSLAACSSSGGGSGGSSDNSITFAYSNAVQQAEKVPIHLALTALNAKGQKAKESFHQSGDDAVQAVVRGDSDFGVANASTVLAATKQGVPIKAIMVGYLPSYVIVAKSGIVNAGQLGGKRFGIQATVSSGALYTRLALKDYPGTTPKLLVIPNSGSRIQALIAGQLDASTVQYADFLALQAKAPGKFHIIYSVAQRNPNIVDALVFTSTKLIATRRQYVQSFVTDLRKEYVDVYRDKGALASAIGNAVPGTSSANATTLANVLSTDKLWPTGQSFTDSDMSATLAALKAAGILKNNAIPTFAECCDSSFASAAGSSS